MAARRTPWRVSDRLWAEVEPLLPKVERRFRAIRDAGATTIEACLEGILYVLRYAVPWAELPRVEGWPSGQTCWRRFHEWQGRGLGAAAPADAGAARARGLADWSRAIVDASLVDAKGGAKVARSLRGRPRSRFTYAVDANGAPFADSDRRAGNENERAHLLPLIEMLQARGTGSRRALEPTAATPRPRSSRRCVSGRSNHESADRDGGRADPRGHSRPGDLARQAPTSEDPRSRARHRWPVERTNS